MIQSQPARPQPPPSSPAKPDSTRYVVLDALRGIGALMVVFGHYHFEIWPNKNTFMSHSSGYLVVDVFFILSGFVLAHAFYEKPNYDFWSVAKKRVFRMWPLHVVVVAVMAALMTVKGTNVSELGLGLNLLLLHNIGIGEWWTNSINYPSWSLSVELVVNIAIGLLLALIPSRRVSNFALAAISAVSAAILFLTVENLDLQTQNVLGVVNTGLLRGFMSFPLGILVYRLFAARKPFFEKSSLSRDLLVAFLIVAVMATFCLPGRGKIDFLYIPFYAVAILFLASPGAFWTRIFGRFKFLGDISFAVYIVHMLPLKIMKFVPFWPQDYVTGLVIAWVLSVGLAIPAHYIFERPVYDWLNKRYGRAKSRKAAQNRSLPAHKEARAHISAE